MTNLAITTTFVTNDSVQYSANYTSLAPIDFNLTVSGPGNYFVGTTIETVTNSTGSLFPHFYAYLQDAPAGTSFNEAGWSSLVFSNGPSFLPQPFPNSTELEFSGAPGLGSGDSTVIGVGFQIPASVSGSQSLVVLLSPTSVPEPSSLILGLASALAGVGYFTRRLRHRA